ncbi:hypothetical protein [Limnohabitans sp. Jir72]|uniref:VHL beta domain-containing protein n=1 Tax=Limnohabitans sp. Jir72 TaxID=1977909 RepID=UPI000D365DED|nr:hypothetical protein [Limnohabitans sp. Jir72]PUE35834.1 hypothetical protein B9Z52_01265 [Limnohabitans sp. Jir72]
MQFPPKAILAIALLGMVQISHAGNPLGTMLGQEADKLQQRGKDHALDAAQHGHTADRQHEHAHEQHGQDQAGSGQTCPDERGLRSAQGNVHTTMNFLNKRVHEVRTYWLDYQGRRVFYKAIPAKTRYTQPTYQTHPWVVTDQRDNCIGVFISNTRSGMAEIR